MITGIVIGVLVCISIYLGKQNLDLVKQLKETPKTKPKKISKEEKEKIERINKSFEELMSYDHKTALRSDK